MNKACPCCGYPLNKTGKWLSVAQYPLAEWDNDSETSYKILVDDFVLMHIPIYNHRTDKSHVEVYVARVSNRMSIVDSGDNDLGVDWDSVAYWTHIPSIEGLEG